MLFPAQIHFGAPLLLAAFAVLPVLWWLLKVTPPQPKRIFFPPLRLLLGLKDQEQTPSRTPWWLIVLRVLAASLLILALAQPLFGRSLAIKGNGPLVMIVDNGWTAARDWAKRQSLIAEALQSAGGRPVAILSTAIPGPLTLLDAGAAVRGARELKPAAWPGDRKAAGDIIAHANLKNATFFWLSDGIEDGQGAALRQRLASLGALRVFAEPAATLGLLPSARDGTGYLLSAIRAGTTGPARARVAAIGARGETLSEAPLNFEAGQDHAAAHIALPMEIRNQVARLEILGENSAGAVQLLSSGSGERRVGIVSAGVQENEQPLLSDVYYLQRALAPFAQAEQGTIGTLVARHVAVLFLADVAHIAGSDADAVGKFIAAGGVLVRFAGPRMANGTDAMVPVPLRIGGRYIGSALAWDKPQSLAPFSATSPFNGLPIPQEVTVTRQILAEPGAETADHAWAGLADGTPLVTARQQGAGWIVLFHVTASPGWSSLPLSGLYVEMLKRVLALSAGARTNELASLSNLAPISVLDGFGRTQPPPADSVPIAAKDFVTAAVSAKHPPGLYGAKGAQSPLNVLGPEATLTQLDVAGAENYGGARTLDLQPFLLALGAALLCLDALLSLGLRGYLPQGWIKPAAPLLALFLLFPAHARADEQTNMKAALDTRLAYVVTGLSDVDAMSQAGLTGLARAVKSRTSYEPQEPLGVDLEKDDLSFYPLLYWPMDPREKSLSPAAQSKVVNYMRLGGTVLFDTRDLTLGAVRGAGSPGEQTLRRITAGLDLPPLEPVPADHVLTKAFYILHDFPGRWTGGNVWVEALPPPAKGETATARGGDGVSPVIVGGNDWAAAWAVDASGRPIAEPVPGGRVQREMALRFGVNVVMYALTGNYKTDQVHAPALLQRLGNGK